MVYYTYVLRFSLKIACACALSQIKQTDKACDLSNHSKRVVFKL